MLDEPVELLEYSPPRCHKPQDASPSVRFPGATLTGVDTLRFSRFFIFYFSLCIFKDV